MKKEIINIIIEPNNIPDLIMHEIQDEDGTISRLYAAFIIQADGSKKYVTSLDPKKDEDYKNKKAKTKAIIDFNEALGDRPSKEVLEELLRKYIRIEASNKNSDKYIEDPYTESEIILLPTVKNMFSDIVYDQMNNI